MSEHIQVDICVIGAGAAGLAVASGTSQMGAKTIVIESDNFGGGSLYRNCIPSKAIIASSQVAEIIKNASKFGIQNTKSVVDHEAIQKHIQRVIKHITPNASKERHEGMGIQVITGSAEFISSDEVKANDQIIKAKKFVIATGSSPAIPPYPGLTNIDYLTNETVFFHKPFPQHLIILGGNANGIEIAQAFARLGTKVTILEMFTILNKCDPEMVNILRKRLLHEGIEVREKIRIHEIKKDFSGIQVVLDNGDEKQEKISGSDLYVAAGRKPNVDGLNLDAADIEANVRGIIVDRRMRTTNKNIFAIGDVTGQHPFTSAAQYQAGIVLKNLLFKWPSKVDYKALPWVAYSSPQIAQVGLTEKELKLKKKKFRTLRATFDDNDRAQIQHYTAGMIKVLITPYGKILGVCIVGPQASELITTWSLAIKEKMHVSKVAGLITPYPTFSEISKQAATSFFITKLFDGKIRKFVQFLQKYF